ncbi:hypothetical protein ACFS7Z_21385 [Pontibacter toksunensis]|uniref:Uncharacterized protein n=1 Tax=Pontibacter toksunensis TaxID=1332631 RepID=A0ABW6BZ11_9BACT
MIPVFLEGDGGRGPLFVNNAVPNAVRQPTAERWQLYLHSAERENAPPREWSARKKLWKRLFMSRWTNSHYGSLDKANKANKLLVHLTDDMEVSRGINLPSSFYQFSYSPSSSSNAVPV